MTDFQNYLTDAPMSKLGNKMTTSDPTVSTLPCEILTLYCTVLPIGKIKILLRFFR